VWLGTAEATDKSAAVEKAAQEFKTEVRLAPVRGVEAITLIRNVAVVTRVGLGRGADWSSRGPGPLTSSFPRAGAFQPG
jgi:hypothetical protein